MRSRQLIVAALVLGCCLPAAGQSMRTNAAAALAIQAARADLVPTPPTPDPSPSGVCENCYGTGRSGDGLSVCAVCGGSGKRTFAPHAVDVLAERLDRIETRVAALENKRQLGTELRRADPAIAQTPASQPASQLRWRTQIKPAIDEAAGAGRFVFLYWSGDFCAPCVEFERRVLSDTRVQQEIGAAAIPLKVKLSADQPELAQQWKVERVPQCQVFVPRTGHCIFLPQEQSPEAFLAALQDALRQAKDNSAGRTSATGSRTSVGGAAATTARNTLAGAPLPSTEGVGYQVSGVRYAAIYPGERIVSSWPVDGSMVYQVSSLGYPTPETRHPTPSIAQPAYYAAPQPQWQWASWPTFGSYYGGGGCPTCR